MTLSKDYFLICDYTGCIVISPDFDTPAELRKAAKKIGWERLHNPEGVRLGYVDLNDARYQKYRRDYCPTCAPKVREELIVLQTRMAKEDADEEQVAQQPEEDR